MTDKPDTSIIQPRSSNAQLLKMVGKAIPDPPTTIEERAAHEAMNVLWYRLVTIHQTKRRDDMRAKLETLDPGELELMQAEDVWRIMATHPTQGARVPRRWLQQRCGNIGSMKRLPGAFPQAIERMLMAGQLIEVEPSVYGLVTNSTATG